VSSRTQDRSNLHRRATRRWTVGRYAFETGKPSFWPPGPTPAPSQGGARGGPPPPPRRGMAASLRSSLVPWRWGSPEEASEKKTRPLSTRPLSACFQQAAVPWSLKVGWAFRDSGVALATSTSIRELPATNHKLIGNVIGWSSRRIFCEDGSDFDECLAVGHGSAGLPENLASKSGPVCESLAELIPAPAHGASGGGAWCPSWGLPAAEVDP
jgi:hypothetical protein